MDPPKSPSLVEIGIAPRSKADQDKLGVALGKMVAQDPSVTVFTDPELGSCFMAADSTPVAGYDAIDGRRDPEHNKNYDAPLPIDLAPESAQRRETVGRGVKAWTQRLNASSSR